MNVANWVSLQSLAYLYPNQLKAQLQPLMKSKGGSQTPSRWSYRTNVLSPHSSSRILRNKTRTVKCSLISSVKCSLSHYTSHQCDNLETWTHKSIGCPLLMLPVIQNISDYSVIPFNYITIYFKHV